MKQTKTNKNVQTYQKHKNNENIKNMIFDLFFVQTIVNNCFSSFLGLHTRARTTLFSLIRLYTHARTTLLRVGGTAALAAIQSPSHD